MDDLLAAGDPINVRQMKDRWELTDSDGRVIGRLSRSFAPPVDMRCVSANVYSIISWRSKDTEPEYLPMLRCDQWEVVLPELVFEPITIRESDGQRQDFFFA